VPTIKLTCPFCTAPVALQIQGAFVFRKSAGQTPKEKSHAVTCQKCRKPFTVIVPANS